MTKGYWIGRVTVTDPHHYAKYVECNAPVFAKWGGQFLVRGGQFQPVEGASRERNVVIEFESYEKALACYHSPEYQEVRQYRQDAGAADIIVIEGA